MALEAGDTSSNGGEAEGVGHGDATPRATAWKGREPPNWVPLAGVIAIPLTAITAGLFGRQGSEWAIATLFVGCCVFLFLAGMWVSRGTISGAAASLTFAVVGAAILVIVMLSLTKLATKLQLSPAATTTTSTSSTTVATTAPPATSTTTAPQP